MGLRQPHPWEADQAPRRVPDTDPAAGRDPSSPEDLAGVLPGAAQLAHRAAADPDPHRTRRGAQGAAQAMHAESQARGWGLDATYCRDRVNTARSHAASKRNR